MRNEEKSNLDLPEAADIWDEMDYESLEVSRNSHECRV